MRDRSSVVRLHLEHLPDVRRFELHAWLADLGVDPDRVRPEVTLMPPATWHGWQLHLSRYLVDDDGSHLVDVNLRAAVTMPLVIDVAAGAWPAWLGEHTTSD